VLVVFAVVHKQACSERLVHEGITGDDLNALFSKPLVLTSSKPGETLLLYVVATTQVISAALVVEREEPWYSLLVAPQMRAARYHYQEPRRDKAAQHQY
jgi:hypothetical protein